MTNPCPACGWSDVSTRHPQECVRVNATIHLRMGPATACGIGLVDGEMNFGLPPEQALTETFSWATCQRCVEDWSEPQRRGGMLQIGDSGKFFGSAHREGPGSTFFGVVTDDASVPVPNSWSPVMQALPPLADTATHGPPPPKPVNALVLETVAYNHIVVTRNETGIVCKCLAVFQLDEQWAKHLAEKQEGAHT